MPIWRRLPLIPRTSALIWGKLSLISRPRIVKSRSWLTNQFTRTSRLRGGATTEDWSVGLARQGLIGRGQCRPHLQTASAQVNRFWQGICRAGSMPILWPQVISGGGILCHLELHCTRQRGIKWQQGHRQFSRLGLRSDPSHRRRPRSTAIQLSTWIFMLCNFILIYFFLQGNVKDWNILLLFLLSNMPYFIMIKRNKGSFSAFFVTISKQSQWNFDVNLEHKNSSWFLITCTYVNLSIYSFVQHFFFRSSGVSMVHQFFMLPVLNSHYCRQYAGSLCCRRSSSPRGS